MGYAGGGGGCFCGVFGVRELELDEECGLSLRLGDGYLVFGDLGGACFLRWYLWMGVRSVVVSLSIV